MSPRYDPRNPPAWPLGCGVAFLGQLLIFNLLGLGGVVFAAGGLPIWVQRGGPFVLALAVPALMLWGGLYVRGRNPYASRTLLWACAITVATGVGLTLLFNLIDRLSGV